MTYRYVNFDFLTISLTISLLDDVLNEQLRNVQNAPVQHLCNMYKAEKSTLEIKKVKLFAIN